MNVNRIGLESVRRSEPKDRRDASVNGVAMLKCERCGGSVITHEELNETEHILSHKCTACGHNHEEVDLRKERYVKRILQTFPVNHKA